MGAAEGYLAALDKIVLGAAVISVVMLVVILRNIENSPAPE